MTAQRPWHLTFGVTNLTIPGEHRLWDAHLARKVIARAPGGLNRTLGGQDLPYAIVNHPRYWNYAASGS